MREQVKQKSVLKFLEAFSVNKSKKGLSKACQRNAWSGSGSGSIFFFFFKESCFRVRVRVEINPNLTPTPTTAFFKEKIDPDPSFY